MRTNEKGNEATKRLDLSEGSKQRILLEFIHEFWTSNRYCVSKREMADKLKTSTSVVSYYQRQLKAAGLVDYIPLQSRTLHLTEEGIHTIAIAVKMEKKKASVSHAQTTT